MGIVGLGRIGGGLAELLADRGVPLTLYVRRTDAAEAILAGVRRRRARLRDAGRAGDSPGCDGLAQIRVTRDFADFHDVDLAVEAVTEDLATKRAVLAAMARACPDRAILASTTSELPLGALGDGLTDGASRLVGAHFLAPVRLSTVVEVIPGPGSAPRVVSELADWVRSLGKRPFVFRRSVVNRVLAAYIAEGLSLCVASGIGPEEIDAQLVDAGMAMGPLATLDLVGLDLAVDVFSGCGAPLVADDGLSRRLLETLCAEGHLGRKSDAGIFLHGKRGRGANPRLLALLAEAGEGARRPGPVDVVARVWRRLIDEYLCCVRDDLGDPDDIDLVLREVLGTDQGPLQRLQGLGPEVLRARLADLGCATDEELARGLLERHRGQDAR